MNIIYIDVREPDEFKNTHLKESVNIPLSVFQNSADAVKALAQNMKVVLLCQSGTRAGNAYNLIDSKDNIVVFEGGLNKWQDESLLVKGQKQKLSIMRQVMIAAGLLVLLGSIGTLGIHVSMVWLTIFVGAGLLFAGVSGICMMAQILGKMPWNS
jgi:rhodanese-related sulfurtransferase